MLVYSSILLDPRHVQTVALKPELLTYDTGFVYFSPQAKSGAASSTRESHLQTS